MLACLKVCIDALVNVVMLLCLYINTVSTTTICIGGVGERYVCQYLSILYRLVFFT